MTYNFYVDGSYRYPTGIGAWAWVYAKLVDRSFHYGTHRTGLAPLARDRRGTEEIEIHAILQALLVVPAFSEVNVYTDSEPALRVLTDPDNNWSSTKRIRALTMGPEAKLQVILHKIPRRSDIFAEYADSLASHRRRNEDLGPFWLYCARLGEKEVI